MNVLNANPSPDHARGLKVLEQSLVGGKAKAAVQCFQELAGQTADPARLGVDLRGLLRGLYEDLQVRALFGFIAWLKQFPERDVAEPSLAFFEIVMKDVNEWAKRLEAISNERLAREVRERVRSRDVKGASEAALRILSGAKTDEGRLNQARRMGVILGSLGQDRPRTEKVIEIIGKHLSAAGLTRPQFDVLRQMHDKTQTNLALSAMAEHERQFNLIHMEAVVELVRKLPGRGAIETRPTEEQEGRFLSAVLALVAAFVQSAEDLNGAQRDARFLNVARILREFCPADEKAAGPVEGIEDVAFLRLPPLDKLISVRVMRRMGQKEVLVDLVGRAGNQVSGGRSAADILSLMGGLSNAAFFSSLSAALQDKKLIYMRDTIVDAFGRIGDRKCLSALHKLLVHSCGVSFIDPPSRRRIANCLAALGRIARHPDTTAALRNDIVLKALKALPSDRQLGRLALHDFCNWNPAALSADIQHLVVVRAVDNLWTLDSTASLSTEDSEGQTELGFRDEMVQILVEMGAPCLPLLLKAAEPKALQYSGGYMAIAEVLTQIGNVTALPFLERILTVILKTDESSIVEIQQETYFDAALNKQVPLSRDKMAHSVVYAIDKSCGSQGRALLENVTGRIRANEFDSLGEETMALLAKILVGDGSSQPFPPPPTAKASDLRMGLVELGGGSPSGQSGGSGIAALSDDLGPFASGAGLSTDDEMSGASAFGPDSNSFGAPEAPTAPPPPQAAGRPREGDSLKSLLKDVRGKGLLGVKMGKRISAIQEVGARHEPDAIGALCEPLGGDEKILSTACETALLEIVNPRHSMPIFRHALYTLLDCLRKAPRKRTDSIAHLIDRMHPERDPVKQMLLGFIDAEPDVKLKKDVADLFRLANDRLARSGRAVDLSTGPSGIAPPGSGGVQSASVAQDKATLKRDFFNARRAWITGGKKGPEPPRPAGI